MGSPSRPANDQATSSSTTTINRVGSMASECLKTLKSTSGCKKMKDLEKESTSSIPSSTLHKLQSLISAADTSSSSDNKTRKLEYDEGLNVYKEDLPLDDTLRQSAKAVIIVYNAAQGHLREAKYLEAKHCLELACLRMRVENLTLDESYISTRVYHNLGYCFYRLGNHQDSLRCFMIALAHAKTGRRDELVEAHTRNAIGVLLFHEEPTQFEDCLAMFQKSLKIYKRHYDSQTSTQHATLLNNIGRVYFSMGEYETALKIYEKALDVRRCQLPQEGFIDVAATICNTGQTHQQLGNLDEAAILYEEFLGSVDEHLGANHTDVGIIIKCFADIICERGDVDKAKEMYEKALEIIRASGEFHPELSVVFNRLGSLHYGLDDLSTALDYYIHGLRVEKAILDPHHPRIIVTLMNIAQLHRREGKYREALEYYLDIHERTANALGAHSIQAATAQNNVALMHYQLQDYNTALDLYQSILNIQRDHYKSNDHVDIASTFNCLGLVFFNKGIHTFAKNCFLEALRLRTKLLGRDHREVAVVWYNLATIQLEHGNEELAIKHYEETLRIETKTLGPHHIDVLVTVQHLGMVHQQRGELTEALGYFEQALVGERTRGEGSRLAVAKLLNLIGNIHMQKGNVTEMMQCYTESSRIHLELEFPLESNLVIVGYNLYGLSKVHPCCAEAA